MVTGASRGLGRAMAVALARAGADVVVTSRALEALEGVRSDIEALDCAALPVGLDVLDLESISAATAAAIDRFGRLDILVNNAGCNVRKPALDVTWEDWDLVVDTNLKGAFFVAQAAAPSMIEHSWGRIINIGSLTSLFGFAGLGPYAASRGGIKQLTMSLADEWAGRGITVNCLAPGWFHTAQNDVLFQDDVWVASILGRIPLGRSGEPEDLSGAVVFLASDASSYITGQTLAVDGGFATGSTRATT